MFSSRAPLNPRSLICGALLSFAFLGNPAIHAQDQPSDVIKPVPILTGATGLISTFNAAETQVVPMVVPVVLLPLGDHWLVESRGEFKNEFDRPVHGSFTSSFDKELDYLQLDFIANRYATITVGRFLTPFGIYNERLYPIWIRNLQTTPFIFPIGTGSSDGGMVRGGFQAAPGFNLNYAAYFSVANTNNYFGSDRLAGSRFGVFLPGPRLEIGASFQQLLQEDRFHTVGVHFEWQPQSLPLDLRSEYARSEHGSGYWAEAGYKLNRLSFWQTAMRHTQVVGRFQQFIPGPVTVENDEYGFPDTNTRQFELGLNYYFRDGLKATSSFGRSFSGDGDHNVWTVGITYRFAFPLGGAQ